MTPWVAVVRSASVIVLAATLAACTASGAPTSGGAASPPGVGPTASPPGVGPTTVPPGAPTPTPVVVATPSDPPAPPADAIDAVPPTEGVLNAIWMGGGRVIVGGFEGPMFTSTILLFDGTSWSGADVPETPGQVTGIAELGDRLIAVGNGLPDIRKGFIWESTDGRTWQTIHSIDDAALYDVVTGDGVIVAAGAHLDAEMHASAAAWISTDGKTWEQAEVADDAGTAMGSVTATPTGFAATGDRPLGEARPFWAAAGASSWAAVENDLSDQLLPIDLVQETDALALVGASGKSGDQHPFVARSADGQRWERTDLSTAEGYASAAAVANDLLVVAGVDADRLTVWSWRSGSWEATTLEERGASISALAWDPDRGFVAVGARGGRHAVWVLAGN